MENINKLQEWLNYENLPSELREEIKELSKDEESCNDAFYKSLEFGTAGLRGIIGAGTNRMNIYTVSQATKGLCEYLKKKTDTPKVAIAYDSRNMSQEFAQRAAVVLAEGGCKVYIYDTLMPTPMLSFAVRELKTDAGIVITASHNPAEYNGYKVYDATGCQISTEVAEEISNIISKVNIFTEIEHSFEYHLEKENISYISKEIIESYYQAVLSQSIYLPKKIVNIVYTPLNGTGNIPVREVLSRIGNVNVAVVSRQENPDKNFTTCKYPNPENKDAMALAIKMLEETKADFAIATDPDCDRVGVATIDEKGSSVLFSGNEIGAMLLEFICQVKISENTLNNNPVAVKTIVTTPMAQAIAESYGVEMINVLTGFKYIGDVINRLEENNQQDRFIFGYEESCGYLSGSFVRDKDAVNACMLICEMASYYKEKGKSLIDVRNSLFEKYGYYKSDVLNTAFEGEKGMIQMQDILQNLRDKTPTQFGNKKVISVIDYSLHETNLPKSNVIEYKLEDKSSLIVRPSGTEPKLKMYITAVGKDRLEADKIAESIKEDCKKLVSMF